MNLHHRTDAARPAAHTSPATERRDEGCFVSVVFSFWNEEQVLPELIRRLRAVFDLLIAAGQVGRYELIFVNDASTDESQALLELASRQRPDIVLVNMSRNFGVSPCVLAGMQFARGDAVIYMDADLQDPPEVIPEMIVRWKCDPEVQVVHTVRRSRQGETRFKRWLTALGYTLLRAVSSIDLPREAGDFKLLSRRAVRHLLTFHEQRPFLRGLVCYLGFKQDVVYYDRQPRYRGKTKFPVLGFKVLRNFFDSALIAFSDLPLKLSTWCGLLMLAGGLSFLGWQGAACLLRGDATGWLAATGTVLAVGGTQLLFVGILGRYVSAIFHESKRRPNFIVESVHGWDADAPAHESGTTSSYANECVY